MTILPIYIAEHSSTPILLMVVYIAATGFTIGNYVGYFRTNEDVYGAKLCNAHLAFTIVGTLTFALFSAVMWLWAARYSETINARANKLTLGLCAIFLLRDLPLFCIEYHAILEEGWRNAYQGFAFIVTLILFLISGIYSWLNYLWIGARYLNNIFGDGEHGGTLKTGAEKLYVLHPPSPTEANAWDRELLPPPRPLRSSSRPQSPNEMGGGGEGMSDGGGIDSQQRRIPNNNNQQRTTAIRREGSSAFNFSNPGSPRDEYDDRNMNSNRYDRNNNNNNVNGSNGSRQQFASPSSFNQHRQQRFDDGGSSGGDNNYYPANTAGYSSSSRGGSAAALPPPLPQQSLSPSRRAGGGGGGHGNNGSSSIEDQLAQLKSKQQRGRRGSVGQDYHNNNNNNNNNNVNGSNSNNYNQRSQSQNGTVRSSSRPQDRNDDDDYYSGEGGGGGGRNSYYQPHQLLNQHPSLGSSPRHATTNNINTNDGGYERVYMDGQGPAPSRGPGLASPPVMNSSPRSGSSRRGGGYDGGYSNNRGGGGGRNQHDDNHTAAIRLSGALSQPGSPVAGSPGGSRGFVVERYAVQ